MTGSLVDVAEAVSSDLSKREDARKYLTDPVLWAKDILDVHLWSVQREVLYSIRDNRNTAVAAGHGIGKSMVASIAMLWWVDVHPLDQVFVASTAPFADQISAILWNNMRILHAKAKKRYEEGLIDHPLPGYITGDNKWKLETGVLIGQGRKPPTGVGEESGFQGLHAKFLLAVGDEAAGLSTEMVDALGNITTGEHNRRLLIANPTDPTCAMAKLWETRPPQWKLMNVSVMESPKITKEEGFPVHLTAGMSGWDYVEEKRAEWGEDDPRYVTRVLGQWAFEMGNNLFTEEDLSRAGNALVVPDTNAPIHFGCDIARMGQDASYVYASRVGDVWLTDPETNEPVENTGKRGLHVRYLDSWTKAPLFSSDQANLGTSQRIHNYALAEGARVLLVDASGLGSGVIDGLAELNNNNYVVIEVFGGAPSSDSRAYLNTRAEQYFELKRRFFAGEIDIDPNDEKLLDELRGILYEFSEKGARKIESKDSMKKRGKKSPDAADALWYACYDVSGMFDAPVAGSVVVSERETVPDFGLYEYITSDGMPM